MLRYDKSKVVQCHRHAVDASQGILGATSVRLTFALWCWLTTEGWDLRAMGSSVFAAGGRRAGPTFLGDPMPPFRPGWVMDGPIPLPHFFDKGLDKVLHSVTL